MDFSFSDEQQLLLDTTRRYLAQNYSLEQRRTGVHNDAGQSPEMWQAFADLGLLALNVPESEGGLNAGIIEALIVSLVMGERLVAEPYLTSAVIATRAIAELGSAAQRSEWLPQLAAGSMIAVLAHTADEDGQEPVRATSDGADWILDGRVRVVYHAPIADLLLIAAHTHEDADVPDALFAIPRESPGVTLSAYPTVDAQVAADVMLSGVRTSAATRLGSDVSKTLPAILDFGTVALCAEAIGALDSTLAQTVEYTRTRSQFGGPISRFQALRHRMADMLTRIEQARSLLYLAASRIEAGEPAARQQAVLAAKVLVADAAKYVGEQAVQLHGGMGLADECAVSHYFKRLLASRLRLGSEDSNLARYAIKMSGA